MSIYTRRDGRPIINRSVRTYRERQLDRAVRQAFVLRYPNTWAEQLRSIGGPGGVLFDLERQDILDRWRHRDDH